ncbi:MAG: hypothetical protein JO184_13775 [Gammaproteobacteria bacterium]|nr:hypothetical protein [Gammaproteobacteria bacterium]
MIAACAVAAAERPPREYLDEETGATVTVVDQPLTFAYARQDLAANAHDFVTLAAASVNRGGRVDYVLIGYLWSTADPRTRADSLPPAEPLTLVADDRLIELRLQDRSAHDAGIGVAVHAPPGGGAPNVYRSDLATLRFIGAARQLALHAEAAESTLTYELWGDQRGALRAFVRHMNGEE